MGCQENQTSKIRAGCGSILALDSPMESSAATGSFKLIPLSQGKFTIVDAEDFNWLNQWKWFAKKNGNNWYAARQYKGYTIWMHRLIMNVFKKERLIDHRNHNGLDNRKCNLRIVTACQQQYNQLVYTKPKTSKFKGVYKGKNRKWRAYIGCPPQHLGYFDSEIEAAKAYDKTACKLFGEFACCNFPQPPTGGFFEVKK